MHPNPFSGSPAGLVLGITLETVQMTRYGWDRYKSCALSEPVCPWTPKSTNPALSAGNHKDQLERTGSFQGGQYISMHVARLCHQVRYQAHGVRKQQTDGGSHGQSFKQCRRCWMSERVKQHAKGGANAERCRGKNLIMYNNNNLYFATWQ